MPRAALVATLVLLALAAGLAGGPVTASPSDAAALIEAGHFKQARALVEPRLRANPNDAEALYLEARIQNAFGAKDEAIKLAERALELDQKNVYYHGALAQLYGEKAQVAGFVEQFSLARKAKEHLDHAMALDPRNWQALSGLVQFYVEAPGIMGGDKQKAQQIADQSVKSDPVHGWLMEARIAQEVKDNARMEQAYENAVKADPNDYNALVTLSSFYLRDGVKQYDQAEKYARAAIKLDPARATAYSLLAAQMVYTHRFGADLDTLLAQAEKADPDDLAPYFVAGRTLVVVGQDFTDAERYLHKYLSQEPEGMAPKHAYAHWRLGQLYQKSGKPAEARAEFEACLRLEPGFAPAKKDLRGLK